MAPLRTRAPLDVDLEDKLIFGLSPVRFGYLAVGALGAYVLASHGSLAGVVRMPVAILLLAAAAAIAWVRWRGRPLDAWLIDLALYARRNLEVEFDADRLPRIRVRPHWRPVRRPRVPTISVLGDRPGAGATTVAVELGAALALKGRRVAVTQLANAHDAASRLGLDGTGIHAATGLEVVDEVGPSGPDCVVIDLGAGARHRRADLALVVAGGRTTAVDARRRPPRARHIALVLNRDRDEIGGAPGPDFAAVVPDDPAVPIAQQSGESVIVQFPTSRAARAFRVLADKVDPGNPGPWHRDSDHPQAG